MGPPVSAGVQTSDSLAAAIRAGAGGHTPGSSAHGWLFPGRTGGHLAPMSVGHAVAMVLPDGGDLPSLQACDGGGGRRLTTT
jgi:integrase/recombinase XerC